MLLWWLFQVFTKIEMDLVQENEQPSVSAIKKPFGMAFLPKLELILMDKGILLITVLWIWSFLLCRGSTHLKNEVVLGFPSPVMDISNWYKW